MLPIDIDFSRLCEVFTYDPQAPLIFTNINTRHVFCLLPCFLIISIIKVAVRTFSCWYLSLWVILYLHV